METRLPLDVEGLTAEWMNRALGIARPEVRVTSARVRDVMRGSATKVRLELTYDGGASLPPTMIVKGGFEAALRAIVGDGYASEARFFARIAPELDIDLPTCWFAAEDIVTRQGIVILEDLAARPATFGDAERPMTPDAVALLLAAEAKLHARWWNADGPAGVHVGSSSLEPVIDQLLGPDNWEACLSLPTRADVLPPALADRERIKAARKRLFEIERRPPHCFLHGDPHLGNLYFSREGAPALLDWQSTMRGPWAHDVAYSIVSCLDVADRRAHDRALLDHYREHLRKNGVEPPSAEEAWLAYRRHALHGLLWILTPTAMQPDAVTVTMARRFAAAASDLETLAALER